MNPMILTSVLLTATALLSACGQSASTETGSALSTPDPANITSDVAASPVTAPACDELEVAETVQTVFDTHQAYETHTDLVLESVSDVKEIGAVTHQSGDWKSTRGCSAKGSLSNGEAIDLWYQIKMPTADDPIGYRVKPCFSRYDGLNQGDCKAFASGPRP